MKTTLDIPDEIFRHAKASAALRGISLRQFVIEALEEKVSSLKTNQTVASAHLWMQGFGMLADLREESRRLEGLIAGESEPIEPENHA